MLVETFLSKYRNVFADTSHVFVEMSHVFVETSNIFVEMSKRACFWGQKNKDLAYLLGAFDNKVSQSSAAYDTLGL